MFFQGFQIFLWVIQLFEIHIHQFFNCIFLISICFILHTMVLFKYLFPNYINHAYFNCLIIVIQFIFICRKLIHCQFSQKMCKAHAPKKKIVPNYNHFYNEQMKNYLQTKGLRFRKLIKKSLTKIDVVRY